MHIKRVFWRFKEWIRKGRMAPDLARKMLTWGLRKEWSGNFIEQSIYKRIWRRTALLNGTRIADTYALDPLDPLGCRHLCILYHWPCWHYVSFGLLRCASCITDLVDTLLVLDFCAAKVKTFPFFFFWKLLQ